MNWYNWPQSYNFFLTLTNIYDILYVIFCDMLFFMYLCTIFVD